jgi:hypothetical protein
MKAKLRKHSRWVYGLACLAVLLSLSGPSVAWSSASPIQVVVEDPELDPSFTTCPNTYWYPFTTDRNHSAYLTLNVDDPAQSSNSAIWRPQIAQTGYYRVEAYIAAHDPITWCTGTGRIIEHDTADAHYSIHHAWGVAERQLSQTPLSNAWLDLGEYYFDVGDSGYISLTDLNHEGQYSTTVSFSAMRFTYTGSIPSVYHLPVISFGLPSNDLPANVGVIQAQGFDVCGLPSVATMQTWWNASPYSFYGLYLGGIQLPSQCTRADAAWVKAVHAQGWSFIPTWVGPQAPCSPWSNKMSADPAVSYQQGRQEAQAASNRAAVLGLSSSVTGGTIIYYDMEVYGGASLYCRQAASAFMNGWVERLHELGNRAGGYGSRNSYVSDWASIAHVPDDVWIASWYADAYDPNASVEHILWLDGLWTNHQRIVQYAGDHHESWGGIGIVIDSDVADGEVALPPEHALANPQISSSPPIEDAGWLNALEGWVVSAGHLYWTQDQGNSWLDISPGPVVMADFLPDGSAWAVGSARKASLSIYRSEDGGKSWKVDELNLTADSWRPIQLQFSSHTNGWIVLRKVTSQAFDEAIWVKTSDGGLSWQTLDLPMAGTVSFDSQTDGWLSDSAQEKLFRTTDAGLSWQPADFSDDPFAQLDTPAGTILSAGQMGGLGWAVTSDGTCQGEKGTASFSCQVQYGLWQSVDDGNSWRPIPIPPVSSSKQ